MPKNTKSIKRKSIKRKSIKRKLIKKKSIKRKSIKRKSLKRIQYGGNVECNIVTPYGDKVILPREFDSYWTYLNLMDHKNPFSHYDENDENMDKLKEVYNKYRDLCY